MTERDRRPLERRRLLGALGAGTAASLAGCLDQFGAGDDSGNGGADGNGGGDGNGPGEREFDPNVDHPGDEPLEFDYDQNCAVCNMTPTDYPDWHSQLAHEDGEGAIACTKGCLFAYHAATTSESPVAGAWTVDHETGDLIDATEAHFVLVTDESEVDDPMGLNPRAFAEEGDAEAFLEEWDVEDLSEDDIVGLGDVDREVASIYRANRL